MKTFRRIEIIASRRQVSIFSGKHREDLDDADIRVADTDSHDVIETGSAEGQEILINAIWIIEQFLKTVTRV